MSDEKSSKNCTSNESAIKIQRQNGFSADTDSIEEYINYAPNNKNKLDVVDDYYYDEYNDKQNVDTPDSLSLLSVQSLKMRTHDISSESSAVIKLLVMKLEMLEENTARLETKLKTLSKIVIGISKTPGCNYNEEKRSPMICTFNCMAKAMVDEDDVDCNNELQ